MPNRTIPPDSETSAKNRSRTRGFRRTSGHLSVPCYAQFDQYRTHTCGWQIHVRARPATSDSLSLTLTTARPHALRRARSRTREFVRAHPRACACVCACAVCGCVPVYGAGGLLVGLLPRERERRLRLRQRPPLQHCAIEGAIRRNNCNLLRLRLRNGRPSREARSLTRCSRRLGGCANRPGLQPARRACGLCLMAMCLCVCVWGGGAGAVPAWMWRCYA